MVTYLSSLFHRYFSQRTMKWTSRTKTMFAGSPAWRRWRRRSFAWGSLFDPWSQRQISSGSCSPRIYTPLSSTDALRRQKENTVTDFPLLLLPEDVWPGISFDSLGDIRSIRRFFGSLLHFDMAHLGVSEKESTMNNSNIVESYMYV